MEVMAPLLFQLLPSKTYGEYTLVFSLLDLGTISLYTSNQLLYRYLTFQDSVSSLYLRRRKEKNSVSCFFNLLT